MGKNVSKPGRPRKDRPRYPSGQVKPEGAGITGTQLQRLRSLGKYHILETQVGRLLFLGEIDQAQAEAAWRIGQIYGAYDRAMGRRRSAASPSYEVGRGRDGAHESEDEAERSAAAVKRFERLQTAIRELHPHIGHGMNLLRAELECLCVMDLAPVAMNLLAVKVALDRLSEPLGLRGRKRD
jgi:hypothetical protein